jgi:hypothetical protein
VDEREEREHESESTGETRYDALREREQAEREQNAEEVAADPLPDRSDDDSDETV